MVQRSTEILPERRTRPRIIRRKQQREHIDEPEDACGAHQHAEDQGHANCKFAVSDEKGDGRAVRDDEIAKHRNHEGVGAIGEETVDPKLETAAERERSAEDFVFAENQEQNSNGNP